jgi:crotonobetainyl-CoA:carnitine CoA-transferase CaiB-like acyl-CoA transferase
VKPLRGHTVLVLEGAQHGGLARLLGTLGAELQPADLPSLPRRLPDASFLIDRLGLARLETQGWSRERIETLNPRLIDVSVTSFGSTGPRALWHGSELVASAMGGTLRLTGEPDRAPVKEALDACVFHADMAAAAGAMVAHYARGQSGRGEHVDVSVQEVALSRNINSILVWQFDRRKLQRVGGALNYGLATVRCIWPLADGWCFHTLMTGRFGAPANQALSDWIDEAGMPNPLRGTDWLRYNRSTLDPAIRAQWESAIAAFFRTRTRQDILIEGRRRDLHATVVASPAEVLADPHLQLREFWDGTAGQRFPGHFVRLTEGQSGRAANLAAGAPATATGSAPLAGVRVLDFSWALVGSITTKILGDLGADVVKVESRTRPCLSRLDVQVSVSRADSLDDKPWFAHLNTSKRSLALDLKRPESRELLEPLISWADLIVENFSPGTMAKLGLDFARLQQINPAAILVSGSVFGQTGPLSQEWGVDGTGAALSGRTYLTGWPDRDPVIPGAVPYGDVIVPYVMAAAAAAALQYRRESGRSCHIDASMYEICVQQTQRAIALTQAGQPVARMGNRDVDLFHQGVYPVAGTDQWIAISFASAAEWQRFLAFAGLSDPIDPQKRDDMLARFTAGCSAEALITELQQRDIAAGGVQDIEALLEHDPQIAFRRSLVELPHALIGPFGHVRTPISFSRSAAVPYRAPSIGEHSRQIARELSGLAPERIDALDRSGVFR